jgi:hypothetical protein
LQTTLLSLAIAIIVAIVAALVAPLFIDWGAYRTVFEREATRLTGVEISVEGGIEARLLPSPRLELHNVAFGSGDEKLRARALTIEFALAPLVRGEWRAAEVRLAGPQLKLALDDKGALGGPALALDIDPDAISIERLGIEDGKLLIEDAAGHNTYALEKLWFNGDLRSLAGPMKGEGAFVTGGELYPFRLSTGRAAAGALKLHLNVDPVNLAFNVEADGTLGFTDRPQFEGTLAISRPVGIAASNATSLVTQPWRFGGKVKVTPASALMQDAEFQYGSDPQAVRLTGTAALTFGARPRFDGVLSARQIELDKFTAEGGAVILPPAATIRRLAMLTGQAFKPAIPVAVGLAVEQVTLGGGEVTGLRGDVSSGPDGWTLDRFEFRAPGFTQVRLSGRLGIAGDAVSFTGPAEISATDPLTLAAWLEGRTEKDAKDAMTAVRPLQLRGDLTLGSDRIAIERLDANFERSAVTGRFVYAFAAGAKGARMDAALNAAELDIDAAHSFVRGLTAGSALERPAEAVLAVEIGRASFAGFDAGKTSARLQYDKSGVRIDRLSIENFGGATIAASGQIALEPPRGNLALQLDARELNGVTAAVARYSPALADRLRAGGAALAPAKLRATIRLDDGASVRVEGTAGALKLDIDAQSAGEMTLSGILQSKLRLAARLDAGNAQVLGSVLGIAPLVTFSKDPASLKLKADGNAGGTLQVEGELSGGGTNGAVKARLAVTGGEVTLDDLNGTLGGANFHGRLAVGLTEPRSLSGEIEADSMDAGALAAVAVGMPAGSSLWNWPADPFLGALPHTMSGTVSLRAMRAKLTPSLSFGELRARVRLAPDEIAFEDVTGSLAGGTFNGRAAFRSAPSGLALRAQIALSDADATAFLADGARPSVSGKVTFNAEVEGAGRSPQAMIGSLQGNGRMTLANGQLAGLDPKVFATLARATDQGLVIERPRIESLANNALSSGQLRLKEAAGDLTINAGQVWLTAKAAGEGADVTINGTLDLTIGALDARLILTGTEQAAGARPDIFVALRGPLAAPERSVDISALTSWLMLRSVERQSKKLEAIEPGPASPPPPPAAPPIRGPLNLSPRQPPAARP